RRQSLVEFRRAVKLGDDQVSQSYQEVLDGEMSELFSNYKKHNDSKNLCDFGRTPITFISCMVICSLIAVVLDAVWLGGLKFIFMFPFWMCFVLLLVWLYTKYRGQYSEIGEYIDYFSDVVWNNVSYFTC
ncbi:unnamed protein product, partial [Didymodactylos carnosus]